MIQLIVEQPAFVDGIIIKIARIPPSIGKNGKLDPLKTEGSDHLKFLL